MGGHYRGWTDAVESNSKSKHTPREFFLLPEPRWLRSFDASESVYFVCLRGEHGRAREPGPLCREPADAGRVTWRVS